MSRVWWLVALMGVISIVAGGIIVAKPSHSLATLAVIAGIFVLLDGILEIIWSLAGHPVSRGLAAIVGVVEIVIGLVLVRHPTHAVAAIGLLIGIWLVAAGAVRLARALIVGTQRFLRVAIAVLEIAVGIAVVANPHIGYATLAVLIGIWLIANGLAMLLLGWGLRALSSGEPAAPRP